MSDLATYQTDFINFLVRSNVLTFGDFVTKSGRKTPYFINIGNINSGEHITELGNFYATHIVNQYKDTPTVIFGPAYKGISLAVATASALHTNYKLPIFFSFNRKEVKAHGDKGMFVGKTPYTGDKIIIVEDVITAGTTFKEVVPILNSYEGVKIIGAILAVDRCEKGSSNVSAVQEVENTLSIKIKPIVTIHQIVSYLSSEDSKLKILNSEDKNRIDLYLSEYGAL